MFQNFSENSEPTKNDAIKNGPIIIKKMARSKVPSTRKCRAKYIYHFKESEIAYAELRATLEHQRRDFKELGYVLYPEEEAVFTSLYLEHHERLNEWAEEFEKAKIREKSVCGLPSLTPKEYPPFNEDYKYEK